MTENEEQLLIKRAQDGDAAAFGTLVERHQPAVLGFLLSLLRDADAAEEAAQEAFVKAFENLRRFENRASFRTWVSRIALNQARSRARWQRLRRWLSLEELAGEDESWEERLRAAGGPADREREALERRLEWERAMTCLSRREKEIVALRLEGYELSETAQTLGVSVGTVKSTLFEATRKLRREFK